MNQEARREPVRAVGYARVSTKGQNLDGEALEEQRAKIARACRTRGLDLISTYDDTGSGADPLGHVRRRGLQDAVARAKAEGAMLMVSDPTRLFRNVEAARQFFDLHDVPVFSVRDARILTVQELLVAITRGGNTVTTIRQKTSDALAKRREDGVKFSTSEVRKEASKRSAQVRTAKSQGVARSVMDVLLEDPAYRDLSHKALADLLNRRGILTGGNRPWTENSVRNPRKRAEELIAQGGTATNGQPEPERKPARVPVDRFGNTAEEIEEMKKNPLFGMF